MKALVVDAQAATRRVIVSALRRHGYDVTSCQSAEAAWAACQAALFPLVLLTEDLELPGLELCRRLRSGPCGPDPVIVLLTTSDAPQHLQTVPDAGVSEYIVVPRDLPLLGVRVALLKQRVAASAAAAQAQTTFRLWSTSAPVGVFILHPNGSFAYTNRQLQHDTGYSEAELLRMKSTDLVHPEDIEVVRSQTRATLAQERLVPFEFRFTTKTGDVRWGMMTVTYITYEGREAVMGHILDVSERKRAETALIESEERYRRLVELSPDAIAVHSEGLLVYINAAGTKLLGATDPGQLIGTPILERIHPAYRDLVVARVQQTQQGGQEASLVEEQFVRLDGQVIDVEVAALPTTYRGKPATQVVVRDITERKQLEARLTHQALHDALTGLPNRTLFMERIARALQRPSHPSTLVAVLFLDLDGFKHVNDSLGHGPGDDLLVAVGQRLTACMRPGDTVARFGGDEFAVLLEDAGEPTASRIATRLVDAVAEPLTLAGRADRVTASVGVALSTPEATPVDLIREAHIALYQPKVAGKAQVVVFNTGDAYVHAGTA